MKKLIFMALSLVVISLFLVGCTKEAAEKVDIVDEQGNIVGEAFKYAQGKYKLPVKEVKSKHSIDLVKLFGNSAVCKCTTPNHVNIICKDNKWANTVNFDNFGYESNGDWKGLQSSQNGYGAFCHYNSNLVPETSLMKCSSFFKDEGCDNFCKNLLSDVEIAEIENNLITCVSYFKSNCNSEEVTIKGEYEKGKWWTVYGLCGEPEEMFDK